MDSVNKMIIFADPRSLSKINYIPLTCSGLYNDCSDISWSDPLDCGFCSHADGNGSVISMKDKMACGSDGKMIKGICPPQIFHISTSADGKYIIEGKMLDNFHEESRTVKVCGTDCPINKISSEL